MKMIDLSATIAPSRPEALPFERVEINYSSHAEGASQIETMLKVSPDLLRNNEGWAVEEFTRLATHSVTHVDAPRWGWDGPLDRQAKEALARREKGVFWAAHQCDVPYSQIERLVNLGSLPPSGLTVACFPLKIKGGSAGPARVVAILPD